MKRKPGIFFAVMVLALIAGQSMAQNPVPVTIPDQVYFEGKFLDLQKIMAEVKGDTGQIVSILGTVFEGTVPKGGNLTRLCNENGWNLIVLMGHNRIDNPDVVAVGACFEYPKTADEFRSALAKGKPLYDAWLAKQSTTFRVNRMKVDTAEIDELNVRVAGFKEKLAIKNMEIDQLRIREAELTERLKIKEAEIENLRVKEAEIENLRLKNAQLENVYVDKLYIKQLEIDNLCELLDQAQARCRELEARPSKVVTKVVPPPATVPITQRCPAGSGCGEVLNVHCVDLGYVFNIPGIDSPVRIKQCYNAAFDLTGPTLTVKLEELYWQGRLQWMPNWVLRNLDFVLSKDAAQGGCLPDGLIPACVLGAAVDHTLELLRIRSTLGPCPKNTPYGDRNFSLITGGEVEPDWSRVASSN